MRLEDLVISCSALGFSRLRTRRVLDITRSRLDRMCDQLPMLPWRSRPHGARCDLDQQIRRCCDLGYSQRMTIKALQISRYRFELMVGAMGPLPWANPQESPANLAASRRNIALARAAKQARHLAIKK